MVRLPIFTAQFNFMKALKFALVLALVFSHFIGKAQPCVIPVMKCFTSQQMKEILSLFSSSIDRLDLAKFAYGFILDRDMYYLTVSSVFSSSLDKENLSNYIQKQP